MATLQKKFSHKKIKRTYGKLFIKTYLGFAAVTIAFAILLGLLYLSMYKNRLIQDYEKDLAGKADKQSNVIRRNLENGTSDTNKIDQNDLVYPSFALDYDNVYAGIVANEKAENQLNEAYIESYASPIVPEKGQYLIERAMKGVTVSDAFYEGKLFGSTIVMAVSPIYGKNGEIVGVLTLIKNFTTLDEMLESSTSLIVMSSLVALGVAFLIAIPFASRLTKPIGKVRYTALRLAAGNYSAKTDIVRSDEIGDLARTIDFLADKLAENEVVRKNMEQMRLDFFANVSHELRTPITVVRAYTESLADKIVTDEEKVEQTYERIISQLEGMERLVGDLLLLSKMQNPDFVVEKELVDLIQLFADIGRNAAAIAEKKNILIEEEFPKGPCGMMGDYVRLRQMFMVIIDNAIKFSPENSSIKAKIEETAGSYVVSITDHGIGIPESDIPLIFDKFYKSKLRQNAKGSGLGLAIAKQIANKHDGTIYVKSEQGVGTTFTFKFPKATKEQVEEYRNNTEED